MKIAWEGIIPSGKTTGGNYSKMEKAWEGIIPRWKKHGRELFLGVKNNGREKIPGGKKPVIR